MTESQEILLIKEILESYNNNDVALKLTKSAHDNLSQILQESTDGAYSETAMLNWLETVHAAPGQNDKAYGVLGLHTISNVEGGFSLDRDYGGGTIHRTLRDAIKEGRRNTNV